MPLQSERKKTANSRQLFFRPEKPPEPDCECLSSVQVRSEARMDEFSKSSVWCADCCYNFPEWTVECFPGFRVR